MKRIWYLENGERVSISIKCPNSVDIIKLFYPIDAHFEKVIREGGHTVERHEIFIEEPVFRVSDSSYEAL